METTELACLADDALAGALPPRDLAVAQCDCKAWRDIVDERALLPRHLPSSVRGIFINYVDHNRPHLFARPSSPSTLPSVHGLLDFIPGYNRYWWTVVDHCNGLLLCDNSSILGWDLCVCNPATRCRELLPRRTGVGRGDCVYLVFDPAVSPHFEVFQVPGLPEIKAPKKEDTDPCRLMEWPPSPWTLQAFSSRTRHWEQRAFIREGEAAGTVQDLHSDPLKPTWKGPRQRYAVYDDGVLYVQCRGSFVARLSLEDGKYQLIKTPEITDEDAKPYLGRSKMGVCFGFVHECQLRVWILNESCGRMEWTLKYQDDLWKYAQYIAALPDGDGPWMVKEDYSNVWFKFNGDDDVKALSEQNYEWDSDNDDDTLTVDEQHVENYGCHFDILGFHPYKEIVFLNGWFGTIAYHMNSSKKVQYLGNTRPRSYHPGSQLAYGMYESFVYTPCIIGGLHEDNTGGTSLED